MAKKDSGVGVYSQNDVKFNEQKPYEDQQKNKARDIFKEVMSHEDDGSGAIKPAGE